MGLFWIKIIFLRNKMFTKLKFENFKAFKSIEVSKLSRVNIFLGENNSGKSTLLDALFILTGIGNPELMMRTNQFRDYNRLKDLSYFFHNFDSKESIILSSSGNSNEFNREASIRLSVNDKIPIVLHAVILPIVLSCLK